MRRAKKRSQNRILVLLDWENLLFGSAPAIPDNFSVASGIEKIDRTLREIGEVTAVFACAPFHSLSPHMDLMVQYQIFPVLCEKIRTKTGQLTDTADSNLIRLGEKLIDNFQDLTHLCIGSGDRDFFPFCKTAQRKGLKIIIVVGKPKSLSKELTKLVDVRPETGEKMIYTFSPLLVPAHYPEANPTAVFLSAPLSSQRPREVLKRV